MPTPAPDANSSASKKHRPGFMSLQTVLIVSVVTQLAIATGLIGWLSFLNGQKAVRQLVSEVSSETTFRIEQHVETFLDRPHELHILNETVIEQQTLDLDNFDQAGQYFWSQLWQAESYSSIYYGSAEGNFVGVQRRDDGNFVRWERDISEEPLRYTYKLDTQGQPIAPITSQEYEPRQRPWYQAAIASGDGTWSDIYPFASRDYPLLGITAAQPVYDGQGKLEGVLSIDLTLAQISVFLQNLKIGTSGQAFIIERSGEVVATSSDESPFITGRDGQQRLKAVNSQAARIRAAAIGLLDEFGSLEAIETPRQLTITLNGQRELVQVTPLRDLRGLDWMVVVVIPEQDFMAQINRNTRLTVGLCLLSLTIAVIVAVLTSRWIARPLLQLNSAAKQLAVGDWEQSMAADRPDEIGELATSFDRMRQQLKDSFDALERKNQDLKQLDELKDEFLANTSHELLTPLNGIIGLAESLKDGATGELEPATRLNLSMIVSSGQRLSQLVQDILDFSKLKHQDLTLQLKPVGIRVVAEIVLSLSRPLVGSKNLVLINGIDKNLPQALVDENRLQQILHNLVSNAIKFTDEGSITISAQTVICGQDILNPKSQLEPINPTQEISNNSHTPTLESSPFESSPLESSSSDRALPQENAIAPSDTFVMTENCLLITVADTGIGIPLAQQERIFQSFEQGNGGGDRLYGGTGLGLTIAQRLVEFHHGKLWVESVVGQGSKFKFTLPIATTKRVPDAVSPAALAVTELMTSSQAIRPDAVLREMVTDSLTLGVSEKKAELQVKEDQEPSLSPTQFVPDIPEALVGDRKAQGNFQFTILAVDDDPINLQVLVNHLKLQNYQVEQASSGAEALQRIEEGLNPDLMLLDVMMPKMTGYEVCRQLRSRYPATELPILMLTAKNQVADLVEGLNSGANDYLNKPVSKSELLARIKVHLELSKASLAYARFVPYEFLKLLGRERIMDVRLGDQIQSTMTVMFADIRSFTAMSEGMTPRENFDFLNSYLYEVCPIIRQYNGFIDKYIGDAVMALFPHTPEDAVQAAIAMQQQVALYNANRQAQHLPPIAIGIGIHTGSLILGTIGEDQRMESTVISDAVNLAARLEKITKLYGAGIVVSTDTMAQMPSPPPFRSRFLDRVQPRGKTEMVEVWEVYEGDAPNLAERKHETNQQFERGVDLYHNGQQAEALTIFESLVNLNPDDSAASLYLRRCLRRTPDKMPAPNWDLVTGDR